MAHFNMPTCLEICLRFKNQANVFLDNQHECNKLLSNCD